ncbi:MAG: diacylglycerol kinase family lipid kinase [Leptospiraceae bacterium]|nr:diacylglycerol kinase family lipid kinase [Leptospiraceae bacterium]
MKIHFIVNPSSGGGSTGKTWAQVRNFIEDRLKKISFEFTGSKGHGVELAKRACENGVEKIVVIGGDGSISEVVTGVMQSEKKNSSIGILNFGTGGDFCRTLGVAADLKIAVDKIAEGNTITADIGKVTFHDKEGKLAHRNFINITGCGMAGEVARTINKSKKVFGGFSYYLSSLQNLLSYKNKKVRLLLDDNREYSFTAVTVAVCNGQYFGGGMQINPEAQISDGLFHITVVEDWSILQKILYSARLYNGTILTAPNVHSLTAKKIVILPKEGEEAAIIDSDGEDVGSIPMTVELIPNAVRFIV